MRFQKGSVSGLTRFLTRHHDDQRRASHTRREITMKIRGTSLYGDAGRLAHIPAVKLAEKIGIGSVVETARRFGIIRPMPPYLPLALARGHEIDRNVSAFTVFPMMDSHRSAHDSPSHQLRWCIA